MSHLCLLGVATLTLTSAGFAGSDTNADLQARIDAAKRVLDYGNRSLAVDRGDGPGSSSISAWEDFGWVSRKYKWYVREAAFNTSGPGSGTVWYQWQFLWDNKLAHGNIDADAAARGGRGLETRARDTVPRR